MRMVDMAKKVDSKGAVGILEVVGDRFSSGSFRGISEYPCGLKLRLGNEELAALRFKVDKHKVGDVGFLEAKYFIESISSERIGDEVYTDVVLQITDLGFKEREDKLVIESNR